ncbi:hypothetical protein Gasu2_43030 [Galdieria sulphuraria]|uniref:Secreted protein n=1 Tax=Galdieria sulphuraria TaxID=130081 RepID=M2Y9T2_GALSU|nr:uncharacterized protein Gasu_00070 [Galdieria sulphuraria]EME32634.1 hypothetical protein Gasu_00070 [Galdieria sulphuraria]GJD10087.1 hypothetical protein Gasu2_43030 [Galdieria sulphuraria]|eukprot:XP_005709154.1 hypothetical protein Gasu_00070 [Galdieria sulphuraria]
MFSSIFAVKALSVTSVALSPRICGYRKPPNGHRELLKCNLYKFQNTLWGFSLKKFSVKYRTLLVCS